MLTARRLSAAKAFGMCVTPVPLLLSFDNVITEVTCKGTVGRQGIRGESRGNKP